MRRGGAGSVGGLLGGKDPTGRFLGRSILSEPAVELPVVRAVHVAVPVEVEVPQVAGVGGRRLEGGPERLAVLLVHVPVAVRVAEEAGEAGNVVAPRGAVPVPVQL